MGQQKWTQEQGFKDLSAGAQEIARYAEENEGSISGILTQKPELMASLDEFHQWSAITIRNISGANATDESGHSLKKKRKE